MKKVKQQKGQALLEVIIAVSIFVGVILGLVVLVTAGFTLSRKSVNEIQAASLIQEGYEAIRKIRDASWDNVANLDADTDYYLVYNPVNKTWSLDINPNTIDNYTRSIRVTDATREDVNANGVVDAQDEIDPNGTLIDNETKKVSITIAWKDRSNVSRSYTATTYLTNWH